MRKSNKRQHGEVCELQQKGRWLAGEHSPAGRAVPDGGGWQVLGRCPGPSCPWVLGKMGMA